MYNDSNHHPYPWTTSISLYMVIPLWLVEGKKNERDLIESHNFKSIQERLLVELYGVENTFDPARPFRKQEKVKKRHIIIWKIRLGSNTRTMHKECYHVFYPLHLYKARNKNNVRTNIKILSVVVYAVISLSYSQNGAMLLRTLKFSCSMAHSKVNHSFYESFTF